MNRVKAARNAMQPKMSMEKLARRVECSLETIRKIEAGENDNPGLKLCKKIAAALDRTLDDLFS